MVHKRIYTLGTGRRGEEEFIEILLYYDIKTVIDVRRFPTSKISIFKKENLKTMLNNVGINYFFIGSELGGFRKGGYEAYTNTEEFKKTLDKLEDIAIKDNSVIICAERFPWKCHRKWIARELHRRQWVIEHIIDKGKIWAPKD